MLAEELEEAVAHLCEHVTVQFSDVYDGIVSIDLITVEHGWRGHGLAKRVLAAIAECADRGGIELVLCASSYFGSNVGELVGLYSEAGFVPVGMNRAGDVSMQRQPQTRALVPAAV